MRFKVPGNPKIEELTKSCKTRHNSLTTLSVIKDNGRRFCAWCGQGQLHHGNQKYCTNSCSESAMAWFYPQKEQGLNVLLIKQNFKCNMCHYDWEPLAREISKQLAGRSGDQVDYRLELSYGLMYRLKMRSERKPEVDHIVPIFKGGQAIGLTNHQILCAPCHRKKSGDERRKLKDPGGREKP